MTWVVHQSATIRVGAPGLGKGQPVYEALKEIPGCQPWQDYGRAISVPATAMFAAVEVLRRHGVAWEGEIPPLVQAQLQEPDEAWTTQRALDGGLFPFVVDGFARPFQTECAAFADRRERAGVVIEPGGGKTLIAILWGCAGKVEAPVLLYVTVASVVTQAADEWRRFADVEVVDLVAPSKRRKSDPHPRDLIASARAAGKLAVLTVGYEVLRDTWPEVEDALGTGPFAVVFDECQRARQPRRLTWTVNADGSLHAEGVGNTSDVMAQVARAATRVLETTATPISNNVMDLWAQLDLLEPGGWGMTASRFRDRYCRTEPNPYAPHAPHVRGLLETHKAELIGRMGFRQIHIPYDVSHAGLPPKRREIVRVRLADQQKPEGGYRKRLRGLHKAAASGDETARVQSLHTRLAEAASRKRGFVVRDLSYRLDAGKGKILVFVGWRKEAEYLGARLDKAVSKRGGQCWVSHGGDSRDKRTAVKRAFLAHPGPAVLIGTWQAWGTGLNLDDVDTIAFTCLPVTPEEVAQAEGRGDRLSMTRPLTYVFYLAEGTADERVVDLLVPKLEQVEGVAPGTRLNALGGIRETLQDVGDLDDLIGRMLDGMAADVLLDDGE